MILYIVTQEPEHLRLAWMDKMDNLGRLIVGA